VNTELERLARSDGLTRIANRSSFEIQLQHHWADHLTNGRELALLMIDVDYFKAYNDYYGHVQGDEALRTVAACLEKAVRRRQDLAARYGGEEFVILLPDSNLEAAATIARRFQALLAEAAVPHAGSQVSTVVTASIGIAAIRPTAGETAQAIVHAADRTLYQAKRAGRNQLAVELPEPLDELTTVAPHGAGSDDGHVGRR
jgi:two-component system cell cycle response regulator